MYVWPRLPYYFTIGQFHDWRAEGVSLYYDLLCICAEICTSTLELCDKYEKDLTDK